MVAEDNLSKLKRLLEEGFLIEQINYHFKKGVLTTSVFLIRGSLREKIVSANEADFFDYIRHFEKVENGYGNMVFMFIEDLQEYKQKMKLLPDYKPVRNAHYIKIGERLLEKNITMTLLQKPGPGVQLARAHFFVETSSNPEFQKLDLNDQVTIYAKDKDELVYKGYVQYLGYGKDTAYFECEIGPRRFKAEKVNAEFIHFNPFDTLYLVTKMSGLTLKPPPEMEISLSQYMCSVDETVTVSGSISHGGVIVTINYTCKDTELLTSVPADSNGLFSDLHSPSSFGVWTISASWPGDQTCFGAFSNSESLAVSKIIPSLTCNVSTNALKLGETVIVNGSIDPIMGFAQINLVFTRENGTIVKSSVYTDVNGTFSTDFVPDSSGTWQVFAEFEGDSTRYGSSESYPSTFAVEAPTGFGFEFYIYIAAGIAVGAVVLILVIRIYRGREEI